MAEAEKQWLVVKQEKTEGRKWATGVFVNRPDIMVYAFCWKYKKCKHEGS
jgi:hypothetical protein